MWSKILTKTAYGGEQIANLRRPTHIVVATLGRSLDLIRRKAIDSRNVKTIVLDVADKILSVGFKKELEEILSSVKDAKSRWLFSATMPYRIQEIAAQFLSEDAVRIHVSSNNVVNKDIMHEYVVCTETEKLFLLLNFIKAQGDERGVVFCKTKATAQKVAKQLMAKKNLADAIHGNLQQKERDKAMRAFKNKSLKILVATDLAARGIDIDALAYVAHYTLSQIKKIIIPIAVEEPLELVKKNFQFHL